MSTIRRLDLRCLLEGIEVPVVSAVIQTAPNAPAMCTIQIVATDVVLQFLDRTVVHLFYKDVINGGVGLQLSSFNLAFSGEMRAMQMSKKVGSRSAFLQCEDVSAYWDQCMQYIQNFSSGGDAFWDRTSSFIGANKGMFDNILRSPEVVISNLVNSKSVTRPGLTGLMAGVIRLFERMGGVYSGKHVFRGQNDFFSAAELRMRIVAQIGVPENDTTSARMMRQKSFINWITNTMGSYGSMLSYRDILKILFQFTFYEAYPLPMGRYNPPSTTDVTRFENVPIQSKHANSREVVRYTKILEKLRKLIAQESVKGKKFDEIHMCMPGIPEDARVRVYITISSIVASLKSDLLAPITGKIRKHDAWTKRNSQYGVIGDYDKGQLGILGSKGNSDWPKLRERLTSGLGYLTQSLVFANTQNRAQMLAYLNTALSVMQGLFKMPTRRVARRHTIPKQASLFTQIMSPNLFFAPPPKCNVIFPEMYMSFDFQRDFRKEITRMRVQLKCWLSGKGATKPWARGKAPTSFLGIYYYAPDILDVKKKSYLTGTSQYLRILLPHERFSGIIPSMQSLGRVNFYLARKDPDYLDNAGGIPYVQRTANFKFFLDRYSARQATVVGVFNEYAVCGLPAVVMDRYGLATTPGPYNMGEIHKDTRRPTQYLGRITQLIQSLSFTEPTTAYTLSNVRTHDESVELIGAGDVDKLRKATPDNKRVQKMVDLRDKSEVLTKDMVALKATFATTGETLLARKLRAHRKTAESIRVSAIAANLVSASKIMVRVATALSDSANSLAESNLIKAAAQLNSAITMSLGVTTFVQGQDKIDPESIPAEEVMRPPWYDKLYDNKNIGTQFYGPLLGCDSIVDKTAIRDADPDYDHPTLGTTSTRSAIDQLVQTYASLKRANSDVVDFMFSYIHRPIATFDEVVGKGGFHRHAFGSDTGFSDMKTDPLLGVENAENTIKQVDPSLDVRAERREIIARYVAELSNKVLLG